jgi:predicted nucleotidyltransferase
MNVKEKDILKTLRYFSQFSYAPTLIELHTFLEIRQSINSLKKSLKLLIKTKKIVEKSSLYTLGEYSTNIDKTLQRQIISSHKKQRGNKYLRFISFIPFVKFVALTGSLAMNNAVESDDIDLFIVAKAHRMWITRFMCLSIAQLLGIRRKRLLGTAPNKICLNLFFDEKNMLIPNEKQTRYVAHEVLQMKPLLNKNHTYEKLLKLNFWVFETFPNALKNNIISNKRISKSIKKHHENFTIIGNIFEQILKQLQLKLINKHRTNEKITDTQLWFFPKDY